GTSSYSPCLATTPVMEKLPSCCLVPSAETTWNWKAPSGESVTDSTLTFFPIVVETMSPRPASSPPLMTPCEMGVAFGSDLGSGAATFFWPVCFLAARPLATALTPADGCLADGLLDCCDSGFLA